MSHSGGQKTQIPLPHGDICSSIWELALQVPGGARHTRKMVEGVATEHIRNAGQGIQCCQC